MVKLNRESKWRERIDHVFVSSVISSKSVHSFAIFCTCISL